MQPTYEESQEEPSQESSQDGDYDDAAQDGPVDFGEVERYLAAEGAYHTRNYSFASSSHGEYQAFLFGQVDRYGALIRLDYLSQFGTEAFGFEVGGHYYLYDDVRAGLHIRFAPGETLIERHGYAPFIEVGLLDRRLIARLTYQFRDFSQANLHDGELELTAHLGRFLTLSPLYRISFVQPGGGLGSQTNHGLRFQATVRPIANIALYGRYGYVQQSFEAAALTPFDSYRAQEFGGGIEATLGVGAGLYFDIVHHDRDNGETYQQYNIGTTIRF